MKSDSFLTWCYNFKLKTAMKAIQVHVTKVVLNFIQTAVELSMLYNYQFTNEPVTATSKD